MRWASRVAAAVLALELASVSSAAERTELGGEIGLLAGALAADGDLSNEAGIEPVIGLRGGSVFSRRWIWYIDGVIASVPSSGVTGDATAVTGRTGLERVFRPSARLPWFATAGAGWLRVDFENSTSADFHRPFVSAGCGQRVPLGSRWRLRWELRGDLTIDDSGLGGESLAQGLLLGGLVWGPAVGQADADGDGVRDARDRCLATPRGAATDARGCPLDSDSDGVPDGIDRCPTLHRGIPVDASGCPPDEDGDGVTDSSDACPGTASGAGVDDWGCPLDHDADGVLDAVDQCPGTALGDRVGPDGCPEAPLTGWEFDHERERLVLWLGFEPGRSALGPPAKAVLDNLLSMVRETDSRFEISGHADATEAAEGAVALSRHRAEAVRDWLLEQGVDPRRLAIAVDGASEPLGDDATDAGRARNRRVEVERLD